MLSGNSDSGAEKREEEHRQLSMTINKLYQRDDKLFTSVTHWFP